MTYAIPPGSGKSDRAIRFGLALDRAMKRRNVGTRTVATAVGCGRTAVMYWRTGRILPRLEMAQRLAAALDDPGLTRLAASLRGKQCLVDAVEFVDDSGSDNRRYCSSGCQRVAEKRRAGVTTDKRAAVAERQLVAHQWAIAAFCVGCEPEGQCVTPDCALRPVSPLPLQLHRFDVLPVRRPA